MPTRSSKRTVTVMHSPGLHARPCLAIVNTVRRFQSKVKIAYGDREDDAGEILNLMSLGVPQGDEVTFSAIGSDAEQVLEALVQLFANDFGFHD